MFYSKKVNPLKKSAICVVIMSSLLSQSSYASEIDNMKTSQRAEQAKENENIGFGTGAVIGGIVAGPLGAVVSSLIGVFTAKHINVIEEKELLANELSNEKNNYQLALNRYQEKLQIAEQEYQSELLALQQTQHKTSQLQAENLLMSLQFSTGSSEIKTHYKEQIDSLVSLLKQTPNLSIDLSGYTDLQGSDELNHKLSIARVNAVKHALIEKGIEGERINLFAFGEQSPVIANNEQQVSFYDRRVVIKLKSNDQKVPNQQTVSNY